MKIKLKKLAVISSIAVVAFASSNLFASDEEKMPPLSEKVIIEFSVEITDDNRAIISGRTNLPDGTNLETFVEPKGDGDNPIDHGVVVKAGMFKSAKYESVDLTTSYHGPLKKGEYTAEVVATHNLPQPASVLAITGKKFENLKGDIVKRDEKGGFVIRVSPEIQYFTIE